MYLKVSGPTIGRRGVLRTSLTCSVVYRDSNQDPIISCRVTHGGNWNSSSRRVHTACYWITRRRRRVEYSRIGLLILRLHAPWRILIVSSLQPADSCMLACQWKRVNNSDASLHSCAISGLLYDCIVLAGSTATDHLLSGPTADTNSQWTFLVALVLGRDFHKCVSLNMRISVGSALVELRTADWLLYAWFCELNMSHRQ